MYDKAAQMYEMDSNDLQVNQMRNKWADLTILSKPTGQLDFAKIIKVYEKIGFKYLSQGAIRGMAKDYFLKAGLCYLANEDLIGLKSALENYSLEDTTFETDRKKKFLSVILTACEARDRDLFAVTMQSYQKITPMDKVQTKLAVKIKMSYCPEDANALETVNKEIDFVNQEDLPTAQKPAGNEEGYDFT